ncbi:putative zinc-binding metallo-peptidase [compost metagenome]
MPLTLLLNSLNRSLGQEDAYPFALSPAALEKLRYVHDVIGETRSRSAAKGPDAKGSSTAASDHDAETATAAHPT